MLLAGKTLQIFYMLWNFDNFSDMLRSFFMVLFFLLVAAGVSLAQGLGGGVWLENGASCVGTIIHNNQSREGFGVAGEDGVLLNCSVIGNKGIVDKTFFPEPGDIYCANGDVVDWDAYGKRATKDAIGVIFWINGDPDCPYPQGAVVSLDQLTTKHSWGDETLAICAPGTDESGYEEEIVPSIFLKDTSCYGNTKKMEEKWLQGKNLFEAGHFCWNYKAYYQLNNAQDATRDIGWCLPVLQYLRRLAMVRGEVKKTLVLLKTTNPGIGISMFDESDENDSNYWSSDDGNSQGTSIFGFCVNFKTGCTNVWLKGDKNWTRPIFLY